MQPQCDPLFVRWYQVERADRWKAREGLLAGNEAEETRPLRATPPPLRDPRAGTRKRQRAVDGVLHTSTSHRGRFAPLRLLPPAEPGHLGRRAGLIDEDKDAAD